MRVFLVTFSPDEDPVEVEAEDHGDAMRRFEAENPGRVALDVYVKRDRPAEPTDHLLPPDDLMVEE